MCCSLLRHSLKLIKVVQIWTDNILETTGNCAYDLLK